MTPEEIDRKVSEQAASLRRQGQTPRVVEFGQDEVATLAAIGKSGPTFTTSESVGGPGFRQAGEPYPHTEVRLLHLDVRTVDDRSRVRVTS